VKYPRTDETFRGWFGPYTLLKNEECTVRNITLEIFKSQYKNKIKREKNVTDYMSKCDYAGKIRRSKQRTRNQGITSLILFTTRSDLPAKLS